MYEPHPQLDVPSDDTVLWRYMDFTKFVSLLEKRALFFCRTDLLGDPFEGSMSSATPPVTPGDQPIEGPVEVHRFDLRRVTRATYVSCWHAGEFESEAMWRLYARERDGIAIKTVFGSFKEALVCDQSVHASRIRYIDYGASRIPFGNFLYPLLHKRISFQHENEVRALLLNSLDDPDAPEGVYCEVDLGALVHEIITAPFAQDWFVDLVRSLARRYGIGDRARTSSLSDAPSFTVHLLAPQRTDRPA